MTAAMFFGAVIFATWVIVVRIHGKEITYMQEETKPKPHPQASTDVLCKRAENAALIRHWIKKTRVMAGRRSIWDWKFASYDATDRIIILLDGMGWVEGTVRFKYDHDFPRVSSFTWMEGDKVKRLGGTPLPVLPTDMLVKAYVAELNNDQRKIKYIDSVAYRALQEGQATFNVCEYEGITTKQYEQIYGLREIRALCKAISDTAGVNLTYDRESRTCIMKSDSEPQ